MVNLEVYYMCFRQKKLYKLYPFIELVKKLESLTIRARAAYGFLCVENAQLHYRILTKIGTKTSTRSSAQPHATIFW